MNFQPIQTLIVQNIWNSFENWSPDVFFTHFSNKQQKVTKRMKKMGERGLKTDFQ